MKPIYTKTTFVDEDGVVYSKHDLKNLYYKTLKIETYERKQTTPTGEKTKIIDTIKKIQIIAKQGCIF